MGLCCAVEQREQQMRHLHGMALAVVIVSDLRIIEVGDPLLGRGHGSPGAPLLALSTPRALSPLWPSPRLRLAQQAQDSPRAVDSGRGA